MQDQKQKIKILKIGDIDIWEGVSGRPVRFYELASKGTSCSLIVKRKSTLFFIAASINARELKVFLLKDQTIREIFRYRFAPKTCSAIHQMFEPGYGDTVCCISDKGYYFLFLISSQKVGLLLKHNNPYCSLIKSYHVFRRRRGFILALYRNGFFYTENWLERRSTKISLVIAGIHSYIFDYSEDNKRLIIVGVNSVVKCLEFSPDTLEAGEEYPGISAFVQGFGYQKVWSLLRISKDRILLNTLDGVFVLDFGHKENPSANLLWRFEGIDYRASDYTLHDMNFLEIRNTTLLMMSFWKYIIVTELKKNENEMLTTKEIARLPFTNHGWAQSSSIQFYQTGKDSCNMLICEASENYIQLYTLH